MDRISVQTQQCLETVKVVSVRVNITNAAEGYFAKNPPTRTLEIECVALA